MATYTIQGDDVAAVKAREIRDAASRAAASRAAAISAAATASDIEPDTAPDIELGPLEDLENLVWIKSNTVSREALKDWERQTKSLGERLDRREKRSEELTNQIYNLIGFFSVFQGVILTAVTQLTQSTQPPRPLCGKVWFPLVLSILAAIAAVIGIWMKFSQLHSIDKLLLIDKLDQRETISREQKLRREGEKFKFTELKDRKSKSLKSYWCIKAATIIGGVVSFTVVFILSYFVILCDKIVITGWD